MAMKKPLPFLPFEIEMMLGKLLTMIANYTERRKDRHLSLLPSLLLFHFIEKSSTDSKVNYRSIDRFFFLSPYAYICKALTILNNRKLNSVKEDRKLYPI